MRSSSSGGKLASVAILKCLLLSIIGICSPLFYASYLLLLITVASSTLKFGSPLYCTLRWQQQITCSRCGHLSSPSISISLYLKISGGCSWASVPRWPGAQWPAARGNVQGAAVRRGAATSHHLGNQVIQRHASRARTSFEVQVHKALCHI